MQETHISKLKEGMEAGGDASLQNGLDLAVSSLKSVPPYGHREVCVLTSAIQSRSYQLLPWVYPLYLLSLHLSAVMMLPSISQGREQELTPYHLIS